MVDFCELSNVDFENSIVKNKFIQSTCGEWIWFVDDSVTNKEDIDSILNENAFLLEYNVVLFCSGELEGEIGLLDMLNHPQVVIYAFGIRRPIINKNKFL